MFTYHLLGYRIKKFFRCLLLSQAVLSSYAQIKPDTLCNWRDELQVLLMPLASSNAALDCAAKQAEALNVLNKQRHYLISNELRPQCMGTLYDTITSQAVGKPDGALAYVTVGSKRAYLSFVSLDEDFTDLVIIDQDPYIIAYHGLLRFFFVLSDSYESFSNLIQEDDFEAFKKLWMDAWATKMTIAPEDDDACALFFLWRQLLDQRYTTENFAVRKDEKSNAWLTKPFDFDGEAYHRLKAAADHERMHLIQETIGKDTRLLLSCLQGLFMSREVRLGLIDLSNVLERYALDQWHERGDCTFNRSLFPYLTPGDALSFFQALIMREHDGRHVVPQGAVFAGTVNVADGGECFHYWATPLFSLLPLAKNALAGGYGALPADEVVELYYGYPIDPSTIPSSVEELQDMAIDTRMHGFPRRYPYIEIESVQGAIRSSVVTTPLQLPVAPEAPNIEHIPIALYQEPSAVPHNETQLLIGGAIRQLILNTINASI